MTQLASATTPSDSGFGYELLVAAIERMQQEILGNRMQLKELQESTKESHRKLLEVVEARQLNVEQVLQQGLGDLKQDSQTQQMIENLGRSTEQAIRQFRENVSSDLRDMRRWMGQRLPEVERTHSHVSHVKPTTRASLRDIAASLDNKYDSCNEGPTPGVYWIQLYEKQLKKVFCEQNHWGNWMVIHRRFDGSLNFDRNWSDYQHGFGHPEAEHWLGLYKLHRITSSGNYELLIAMKRFNASDWHYAHYQQIIVGSTTKRYKLQLSGSYEGTVPDSLARSNGMAFSTRDRDNDALPDGNCAEAYSSGWWFNGCFNANLNGVYGTGRMDETMYWFGVGDNACLQEAMMMIRPSQGWKRYEGSTHYREN